MASLAFEAFVVGIFLAVVLVLVSTVVDLSDRATLVAAGFLVGVGTHLFFEFTGLNAVYCSVGHACTS